jgi:hypothetical protein
MPDSQKSQIQSMLENPEQKAETLNDQFSKKNPPAGEGGGKNPTPPVNEKVEGEEEQEDTRTEVQKLQAQLNEMSRELADAKKATSTKEEEEEEEQPQNISFLSDEELEGINEDPSKWNDVLKKVYAKAREDTLRDIPSIVQKTTSRQLSLQDKVRNFYQENPDLSGNKDFVGFIASELESKNPDKDIDWIFNESAKVARERLGIREEAEETEKNRRNNSNNGNKPAFARKPRGDRGQEQDNRTDTQKEIDAVIDL